MQSNAYFLAKFRFDTAENEPAKNLQFFANIILRILQAHLAGGVGRELGGRGAEAAPVPQVPRAGVQLDQVPHHVRRRPVPAHANPEAFDCLAFCSKLSMALSGISGNTAENGAKSSRHFLRADGSFGALLVRHGRSWKTIPFPRRIAGI